MAMETLQDLYVTKLQKMYDAEQEGLEAMQKMVKLADNPQLKQAFETHRAQSERQVQRLEQIFELQGESAKASKCISTRALITEAEAMIPKVEEGSARDAFLIAAQQMVEHHEIADYGTVRTWARQLGFTQAAALLQQTLDEEEQTDKLLSHLAEGMINAQAAIGDRAQSDREITRTPMSGDMAGSTGSGSAQREQIASEDPELHA